MQLSDVRVAPVGEISLITAASDKSKVKSAVFDQPILPEAILQGLLQVQDLHGLKGYTVREVRDGSTLYTLFPFEAGQAWAIDLYDISQAFKVQVPESQTKLLFILEGVAKVAVDTHTTELQPGQSVSCHPGSSYTLLPNPSGCRFLSLNMLDLVQSYPAATITEAIYADDQVPEVETQVGELDKTYFRETCVNGANAAYDLIEGKTVGGRYNVSILDIVCARKHYHEQETERRTVLAGNLEVELDNKTYPLTAGQMCRISPMVVHRFKSKNPSTPTRLFAINIPAYDPANVRLAE